MYKVTNCFTPKGKILCSRAEECTRAENSLLSQLNILSWSHPVQPRYIVFKKKQLLVDVVTILSSVSFRFVKMVCKWAGKHCKSWHSVVGSPESTIHDSPLTSADKSGLCGYRVLQRVLMEISKQEFDLVNYPCNYCRYKCNPPFLFVHPRCIDNISLRQAPSDYLRASTLCYFPEGGIQTGWRQRSLNMPP